MISIDQGCDSFQTFQKKSQIFLTTKNIKYFLLISIDLGGNSGSPRWREGGEGAKEEATKGEKGEEGEKKGKVRNENFQKFVIFRILLHFIALSKIAQNVISIFEVQFFVEQILQ